MFLLFNIFLTDISEPLYSVNLGIEKKLVLISLINPLFISTNKISGKEIKNNGIPNNIICFISIFFWYNKYINVIKRNIGIIIYDKIYVYNVTPKNIPDNI